MQMWALILMAYLAGAFLLRDNFSEMVFSTESGWWLSLLAFGLIGTAFAGVIRNLLGFLSEDRHRILHGAIALACIAGIEYLSAEYNRNLAPPAPETAALALTRGETSLQRSWDGHFRAIAQIEGADVGVLIDTGASLVLLRNDDAQRMGLDMKSLDFSTPLTTANGKSFVAPITIDTLTIGDVTVHDLRAAVAEPGALHSSLLGMSFIQSLSEAVIQKDRMILRQ